MPQKRKRKRKKKGLQLDDATPAILAAIEAHKCQQEIANELGIGKSKMSRWIAKLERAKLVKTEYRSNIKILRVAKNTIQHGKATLAELHDTAYSYKIRDRGYIPKEAKPTKMQGGWTRYKIKRDNCYIWINTDKIQVQFKERFIERLKRQYSTELEEAYSILAGIADDWINDFTQRHKGWKINMHTRDLVKSEVGVLIKEFKGIKGARSKRYKSLYGTGKVEANKADMISLLERLEVLEGIPERFEVMEKGLTKLADTSIKTVEVLERIENIMSGKQSPPKEPEQKKQNDDEIGYIG